MNKCQLARFQYDAMGIAPISIVGSYITLHKVSDWWVVSYNGGIAVLTKPESNNIARLSGPALSSQLQ